MPIQRAESETKLAGHSGSKVPFQAQSVRIRFEERCTNAWYLMSFAPHGRPMLIEGLKFDLRLYFLIAAKKVRKKHGMTLRFSAWNAGIR